MKYDMETMVSKIITRFLLQAYVVVFAALPLSYIHIEDNQGTRSFVAGTAKQGRSIHLLLHEIFFAHFSNRSDHCSSTCSEGTLSTTGKIVSEKMPCSSPSLVTAGLRDVSFSSGLHAAVPLASVCDNIPVTNDLRSAPSGLSPPSS